MVNFNTNCRSPYTAIHTLLNFAPALNKSLHLLDGGLDDIVHAG
jgi:hypothetical protein